MSSFKYELNEFNSLFIKEGIFSPMPCQNEEYALKNLEFQFNSIGQFLKVGKGGFGDILLAKHRKTHKFCAIKVINKNIIEKRWKRERIMEEISIQSCITHPNIIKLFYSAQDNLNYYMVMEYKSGGNLYKYIKSKGHLSEKEAFYYFIQVCSAIHFLHKNNLAHRDIKPENMLLDNSKKNLFLCDFGWCVDISEGERKTFCGTYEYMAPEIINNEEYGKSSDIWSLGILLYEMLHGYSPFRSDMKIKKNPIEQILYNIREGKFKISNNISDECSDLIIKLLTYNQIKRIDIEGVIKHPWIVNKENVYIKENNLIIETNCNISNDCEIINNYIKKNDNISHKINNLYYVNDTKNVNNINYVNNVTNNNMNYTNNANFSNMNKMNNSNNGTNKNDCNTNNDNISNIKKINNIDKENENDIINMQNIKNFYEINKESNIYDAQNIKNFFEINEESNICNAQNINNFYEINQESDICNAQNIKIINKSNNETDINTNDTNKCSSKSKNFENIDKNNDIKEIINTSKISSSIKTVGASDIDSNNACKKNNNYCCKTNNPERKIPIPFKKKLSKSIEKIDVSFRKLPHKKRIKFEDDNELKFGSFLFEEKKNNKQYSKIDNIEIINKNKARFCSCKKIISKKINNDIYGLDLHEEEFIFLNKINSKKEPMKKIIRAKYLNLDFMPKELLYKNNDYKDSAINILKSIDLVEKAQQVQENINKNKILKIEKTKREEKVGFWDNLFSGFNCWCNEEE